ncbi:MAG: decarboxylating 6-phosphogluconate dehydrogenase [Dehalococcoidia bacterium]|nr:decarboxylating 6-phosphogluconate dehydrogenase [Dehalococcoidia bacterium]
MQLGIIGLGRMGSNMAERLLLGGHEVVAFDMDAEAAAMASSRGAVAAASVESLISKLHTPRAVWVMVPSGSPTEDILKTLGSLLSTGDVVIDGGNSNYEDSIRRAAGFKVRGIHFLDVGTSGGIWGLKEGYCLMVGGEKEAFLRLEPVFKTLAPAPDRGYAHVGPSGAGHFVKMVHNGIEYGLMQAYAEGFELMDAKKEFGLDLGQIAGVWRHGSVVRSWLLDLAASSLQDDPKLDSLKAYVEDSGEGRWTVQESVKLGVPLPVITLALQARFRSRQEQPFGARLLAALRNKFGGHEVKMNR